MKIVEPDFILEHSSPESERYDLTFMKKVKKRDTGKFEIEPGNTLYGLTLPHCLSKIAHHRTAKKWSDDNATTITATGILFFILLYHIFLGELLYKD